MYTYIYIYIYTHIHTHLLKPKTTSKVLCVAFSWIYVYCFEKEVVSFRNTCCQPRCS